MRKCHLNTCPVGVATQAPDLRKRFKGKPKYVERFFRFMARQLREHMAALGFRTIDDMVGRVDRLNMAPAIDHWKAKGLDFSALPGPWVRTLALSRSTCRRDRRGASAAPWPVRRPSRVARIVSCRCSCPMVNVTSRSLIPRLQCPSARKPYHHRV